MTDEQCDRMVNAIGILANAAGRAADEASNQSANLYGIMNELTKMNEHLSQIKLDSTSTANSVVDMSVVFQQALDLATRSYLVMQVEEMSRGA